MKSFLGGLVGGIVGLVLIFGMSYFGTAGYYQAPAGDQIPQTANATRPMRVISAQEDADSYLILNGVFAYLCGDRWAQVPPGTAPFASGQDGHAWRSDLNRTNPNPTIFGINLDLRPGHEDVHYFLLSPVKIEMLRTSIVIGEKWDAMFADAKNTANPTATSSLLLNELETDVISAIQQNGKEVSAKDLPAWLVAQK